MNRSFTIVIALAAGFMGGSLSRYVAPPAKVSRDSAPMSTLALPPIDGRIQAQTVTLVDSKNPSFGLRSRLPMIIEL